MGETMHKHWSQETKKTTGNKGAFTKVVWTVCVFAVIDSVNQEKHEQAQIPNTQQPQTAGTLILIADSKHF